MPGNSLEARVAALEDKLSKLQNQLVKPQIVPAANKRWVEEIWGSFADDPLFQKAMHYGRKWREKENRKAPGTSRRVQNKKRRA